MSFTYLSSSRITDPCKYRTPNQRIRMAILIAVMGITQMPLAFAAEQNLQQSEKAEVASLMTRVGPPSQSAVDEFKKAGMEGVRPHILTAPERAKVEAALASLPSLNRRVLDKELRYLAFVDGIPGEGTGLTGQVDKTGLYDITLRASIVDESLSSFLTTKERRVFSDDGSGIAVTVRGTGTDALTYVLLHESTHVVDSACGITAEPHSQFTSGIWAAHREMVSELASSTAATTYFHGGHTIGIGKAAAVYDALAQTPFVSLYATASRNEDFAELVAWDEVLKQHEGNLVIEVNDTHGKILERWEPLTFPKVQKRFAEVDELLASHTSCSSLS